MVKKLFQTKLQKTLPRLSADDPTLTTLDLCHNNIGVEGAKALARALRSNKSSRKLFLNYTKIADEGVKALAQALVTNQSLTRLDLRHNNIGDEGAKALAQALITNKSLTILDLYYNNIADEGVEALAQALRTNQSLTTLDLNNNKIGDEGVRALALALDLNKSLTILDLNNNNIGVEGAKALARALRSNKSLTELYLNNNNIGVEGENLILHSLEKYNTTLTELRLYATLHATQKKVKKILKRNKEGIEQHLKEANAEEREMTETTKLLTFDGSQIKSRDELVLIHDHLEKEIKVAQTRAEDNIDCEESVTILEDVWCRLEQIRNAKQEFPNSDSGLLSLEEMKTTEVRLRDEAKTDLKRVSQERKKAISIQRFEALQALTLEAKTLKDSTEKGIQDAEARLREAQKCLKARREALEGTGASESITVSPSARQTEVDIENSRLIIKLALESQLSEESPKQVSLEYLELLTKDWSKDCELGKGAQGNVYRGFDKTLNRAVAVKQIRRLLHHKDAFEREIMALSKLNHTNIVRVLARCETDLSFNYLVYEYAAGGTLTQALSSDEMRAAFKWQRRVGSIVSLVHALQYCHSKKVKHRDVKPDNICFLDEDFRQLLLIDFGISTDVEGTITSFGGTSIYMAGEYLLDRKYFNEPQEVYSVGVVMISLVTGKTASSDLEDMKKEMQVQPVQELLLSNADSQGGSWDNDVLRNVTKLANECINKDPALRPQPVQEHLLRNADPQAGDWDNDILRNVSKLANDCINKDPALRPSFENILQILARTRFSTQLTSSQTVALEQAQSFAGSTIPCTQQRTCGCGSKSDIGFFCRNKHYQCVFCLEGSIKRQMGSEKICCQFGRCNATFEITDLQQIVDHELLAEHALEQSRIRQGRAREALINKEVTRMGQEWTDSLKKQMFVISAGIGAIASRRSECPSLCVLWPCRSGCVTVRNLYCKEYQLYFLCGFDRTPTASSIMVTKRRKWVKEVAPVLKYSIMAFKLISAVYGVPIPLPDCISPANNPEEQLSKLIESLSDILGIEDYSQWARDLKILQEGNFDEGALKKLLYQGAETMHAEAHAAMKKMANENGNLGWKDEMDFKPNAKGEWAWVKKSNIVMWEQQG